MTQSPRYRKCTPALWRGLCGMPLALRLNEGLGATRHGLSVKPDTKCFGNLEHRGEAWIALGA